MARPRTHLTIGALTFALAACTATGTTERAEEPYLRGAIESMNHRATGSSITVQPPDGTQRCGIVATVDADTHYLQQTAAGVSQAALADLQIGDTVDVFVTGPIAESCPVQAYASRIVRIAGDDIDR